MPFVKLDTDIINSSLWPDRDVRDVFISALLLAEPEKIEYEAKQLEVRTLAETGFTVPPGWYGLVRAAGIGIIRLAGVDRESGIKALENLCSPDVESRSPEFEGRRMIRVSGGYLVLNYMRYRDYDHSAAERMRKLRARRKSGEFLDFGEDVRCDTVTVHPNVTYSRKQIAEADTEAERSKASKSIPPLIEDVKKYCLERKNLVDAQKWFDYYSSNGWRVGRNPMKDWRAAVRTWERSEFANGNGNGHAARPIPPKAIDIKRAQLEAARQRGEID